MSGRMYSYDPDEIRNKFNTIPASHYLGLFGRNSYYSGLNAQKGYGLLSDFVRNYVLPGIISKAVPFAVGAALRKRKKKKSASSSVPIKGGKIKKKKRRKKKSKSKSKSKKKSKKSKKLVKSKKRKKYRKKKSTKRAIPFPLMS